MRDILIPTDRPAEKNPITRFTLVWFLVLYFMTGMAAYNVGPVPATWLAQAGMIALAIGVILFTDKIRVVPGGLILFLFLIWALFVTSEHLDEFAKMMPRSATLPYGAYVTIRYVGFISFIAALYLTYWIIGEGEGETLVKWIILIGTVIAVFALYIYLAHMLHLPEPPRNRLGTSAGQQAIQFSSEEGFFYSRATGTFREPSGLAEWLILPFLLSFAFRKRADKIRTVLMGAAFSLTLSMMGVFSVAAGTFMALVLTRPFSKRSYKVAGVTILVAAFGYFLLTRISLGLAGENRISLGTLLGNRVLSTIFGGIGKSNRSYVYDFVSENPIPALGYGLGNGNLLFASKLGVDSPASFLSLYLFTLYSMGYPGMILLGSFLLRPIVQYIIGFKKTISAIPLVLMVFIAYLVASAVGGEEVSPWFGIATGLLTWEAQKLWTVRKAFVRRARSAASQRPAVALT